MADEQDDSLALRERLESLPQELYDYIYKLTFTADSRVRCLAKKHQRQSPSSFYSKFAPSDRFSATFDARPYRQRPLFFVDQAALDGFSAGFDVRPFPHDPLFYVDRATRNLYAASYFNSVAVVYVDRDGSPPDRLDELIVFLSTLPAEFRPIISELRLIINSGLWSAHHSIYRLMGPEDKQRVRRRWGSGIADKLVWIFLGGKEMYY